MDKQHESQLLNELQEIRNKPPVPVDPTSRRVSVVSQPKQKYGALCMTCAMLSALFLFLSVLLLVARTTVLNQNFYASAMRNSDYCNVLTEEIKEAIFENGQAFTDAPTEVFDNGLTSGTVLNASIDYCTSCFTGAAQTPDTTELSEAYRAAITKYIRVSAPNLKITTDVAQSTIDLADSCAAVFEDKITVQLLPEIGAFAYQYNSIIDIFAFVFMMIAVILYTPIMFTYSPNYQKIRYAAFTSLSLFIMLALAAVAVAVVVANIQVSIQSAPLYHLFSSAVSRLSFSLQMYAALAAVLTAVAVLAFYMYDSYQKSLAKKEALAQERLGRQL